MGTTQYTGLQPVTGGTQAIAATSSTAVSITISAASAASATQPYPNYVVFIAETNDIRWRDDGTAPTATSGMYLPKNTYFFYDGPPQNLKFITTAGSATIDVALYRAGP